MKSLPEQNHALIQTLAADVHALRVAVLALAMEADGQRLLALYDGGAKVLLAKKQGEPMPDSYLDLIEEAVDQLRGMLQAAAGPLPGG